MYIRIILFSITSIFLVTGCYRMPEEGEVSVVPNTNNPSMTRKGSGWSPGVEY